MRSSQPMDPSAEMSAFVTGVPVAVVPQQDHMSHIQIHVAYLKNPMLGLNPVMVPITAKVLEHLRDHLGHFFATRLQQSVQQAQQQQQQTQQQAQQQVQMDMQEIQARAQQAIAQGMPQEEIMGQMQQVMQGAQQEAMAAIPQLPPPEAIMAQSSMQIVQQDAQMAQEAIDVIKAADEFVRQNMQQQDPNMVAVVEQSKANMKEIERKAAKDQADAELAREREGNLRELEATQRLEEIKQNEAKLKMDQLEFMHKQGMDKLSQQIELMKNDADNRQHQLTELIKNHDDNKTSIILEQIRAMMSSVPKQELESTPEFMGSAQPLISGVQEANSAASMPPTE